MAAAPAGVRAFRITCDEPGCEASETVAAPSALRARINLALGAPWATAYPPTYETDFCPRHESSIERWSREP